MNDVEQPGPLPILVGVTGHRDLRDEDAASLEEALGSIFSGMRRRYPHSPLILLSPLAEGADRLTARVALGHGIRLLVPLPMPRRLYEQDFATPESRKEFCELLQQADGCLDLPLLAGNTEADIEQQGHQRNLEYAKVGAYIAHHCQLFIALWDGVTESKDKNIGGTAQIVRLRLAGERTGFGYGRPRSALMAPNTGPVVHVLTPRCSYPSVQGTAFSSRTLVPARRTAESFDRLCEQIDGFNRDALELRESLADLVTDSKASLLETESASVDDVVCELPKACGPMLEQYAVSDALAVHFARKTISMSKRIYVCVFAAALFLNVYLKLPGRGNREAITVAGRLGAVPWFLLAFLVLLAFAAIGLQGRARRGDYQNKYQDYRALAEALRIQFFRTVTGRPEPVFENYLRKQRSELDWIRTALCSWYVMADVAASSASEPGDHEGHPHLRFTLKHWVAAQREYLASKITREYRLLAVDQRWVDRLLNASLLITVALAAMLTLPLIVPVPSLESTREWLENPWVHGFVTLAIATLALSAGLKHAYSQQMARAEHVRQFGRLVDLFDAGEQALHQMLQEHQYDAAADLIVELGDEALDQSGDWLMLHRERPLHVPHAG